MKGNHHYAITIQWTGNRSQGTSSYRAYDRSHSIQGDGKPELLASSDPSFRGDKSRYNPEELLVASLSSCHMLWYLHLCSEAGVVVTDYVDQASGTMIETADGGGHFSEVTLHPIVTLKDQSMLEKARGLHQRANQLCFIANSVNFPVKHEAIYQIAG
ncbi:MAG: peroxiredoxin [Saprospiraceae bacterium]|nr:MAG: peroxiredoxin [Saprospiraceae bacterium]